MESDAGRLPLKGMVRIKPRRVRRTGDDAPAASLARYTMRMTGWHQAGAALLAIAVAVVNLAPIDLQRRIVDDAITPGDARLLLLLAAVYIGAVLVARAGKLALALLQGWLAESAARYTREHLDDVANVDGEGPGTAVSIIGSEVERLAGFVGAAPSTAAADAATLLAILAWMLWVEPAIALVGIALLLPQVLLAPLLQRRVNRLVRLRVSLMRSLGERVASREAGLDTLLDRVFANRMAIHAWKAVMKGLLNLANQLAPLGILLWGGFMVIEGETTLGVVIGFLTGLDRMSAPARGLIAFYRQSEQARVQHDLIASWMTGERKPAGGAA